MHAIVFVLV